MPATKKTKLAEPQAKPKEAKQKDVKHETAKEKDVEPAPKVLLLPSTPLFYICLTFYLYLLEETSMHVRS